MVEKPRVTALWKNIYFCLMFGKKNKKNYKNFRKHSRKNYFF